MSIHDQKVIDLASVLETSEFAKQMMAREVEIAEKFGSLTATDAARNNLLCMLDTLEHHAKSGEPLPPEAPTVLYGYLLHTMITMNSEKAEQPRIILPNAANN
jgi:hypothetical protein